MGVKNGSIYTEIEDRHSIGNKHLIIGNSCKSPHSQAMDEEYPQNALEKASVTASSVVTLPALLDSKVVTVPASTKAQKVGAVPEAGCCKHVGVRGETSLNNFLCVCDKYIEATGCYKEMHINSQQPAFLLKKNIASDCGMV